MTFSNASTGANYFSPPLTNSSSEPTNLHTTSAKDNSFVPRLTACLGGQILNMSFKSAAESVTENDCALTAIRKWVDRRTKWNCNSSQRSRIPKTSEARQSASVQDRVLGPSDILGIVSADACKEETVLYLGYASNLSAETFLGRRGIRPLSKINVVVPDIALTFDLPGIPYSEPCFGNVRYRDVSQKRSEEGQSAVPDYHKSRWKKGLVGVVYEVTKADYAHIIATEGGGASYRDVLVDCYALSVDPHMEVPEHPTTQAFKAHTLFSPPKVIRKDANYAQPSPRYHKLITDGAAENALPFEYQDFLHSIGAYTVTYSRQRLGQFIFLSIWGPFLAFFFVGMGRIFLDKYGRYPEWFAKFAGAAFQACWGSYDDYFKDMFGDGERTVRGNDDEEAIAYRQLESEKSALVTQSNGMEYGTTKPSPLDR